MAVKTIDLTRNIRDKIYNNIKDLSKEDQIKYYRLKASKLKTILPAEIEVRDSILSACSAQGWCHE